MYTSLLVPIDLGHESSWRKALPLAVDLARTHGAELHVMVVVPDFGLPVVGMSFPADFEEKALHEVAESLRAFVAKHVPEELSAHCHVGHGTIYSEIIACADKLRCDLIVLASHRPEMRDYLIGPNASRVVRHARQSVFVVRE